MDGYDNDGLLLLILDDDLFFTDFEFSVENEKGQEQEDVEEIQ